MFALAVCNTSQRDYVIDKILLILYIFILQSDLVSGNSPKLILQYIVKVTNAELVFCLKQLSMDYALGRDSESNGHAAWSNRPYANRKLGPIPFSVKLDQRLKHHQHYVLVLHSLGIWRFITLLQPSAEEPLWTCVLRTYGHSIAIANFHDVLIEFQSRIRSQESVTHKVLEEAQAHTPSMNGTPTSANGVMVDASTKGGYDGMYAITLLHVTEVLKRCTGREDATSLSTPFELLFCQEVLYTYTLVHIHIVVYICCFFIAIVVVHVGMSHLTVPSYHVVTYYV